MREWLLLAEQVWGQFIPLLRRLPHLPPYTVHVYMSFRARVYGWGYLLMVMNQSFSLVCIIEDSNMEEYVGYLETTLHSL